MGNHGGSRTAMSRRAGGGDIRPTGRVRADQFSAYGKIDPYAMRDLYGLEQLHAAISRLPIDELQRSAEVVQARNPGTAPASRARKAALVAYIMAHVAPEQAAPRPTDAAASKAAKTPKAAPLSVDQAHAAFVAAARNPEDRAAQRRAAEDLVAAYRRQERGAGGTRRLSTPARADPQPLPGRRPLPVEIFGTFDPYPMFRLYGEGQTRRAISEYPLATLKEGADEVMRRNPGTKPRSRASVAALVDYIMAHIPPEDR